MLPVFLFLSALIFLDSYKLVKFRSIVFIIFAGGCIAGLSFVVNSVALAALKWYAVLFTRYVAPVIEESLKSMYLLYLIRRERIGFMVDAAIDGFAIGAGFAFIENIYYLELISSQNILLWFIRGLGTAMMHGGTTAMFGVVVKNLSDRSGSIRIADVLPGLTIAVVTHSLFNHFFVSPVLSTVFLVLLLPAIIVAVFRQSEKATRSWLGVGFDTDVQVLDMITTGNLAGTNIGKYLQSIRHRFSGDVVVDMLCLLRIHVELSVRAKGVLLMREAVFRVIPDPELKEKFTELEFLEKSVGRTGQLAMAPFLHTSSRDLWQFHMLGKK